MSSSAPSSGHRRQRLVIGTRNSVLALAQMKVVHQHLLDYFPDTTISVRALRTSGDMNLTQPLYELARKALWTDELEQLLLARTVDLVVHSLKGRPAVPCPRRRAAR